MKALKRCGWAKNPLAIAYHDREWGVPVHDDRVLFEFLILEGAQAGLSWDTILARRERYRSAFDGFDPRKVARYGAAKKARLLANAGIVRNRLKIGSAVGNARAFLAVQEEFGSFAAYAWGFVGGRPLQGKRKSLVEVPASSAVSDALSKDLKRRGFKFVGTTIMYAFMQATGMVNDHVEGCFRRAQAAVNPGRREGVRSNMSPMRAYAFLLALSVPAAAAAFDANSVSLGGNEALVKKQYPSAHCKPLDWKSDAADRRCDDAHVSFRGAEAKITFFLKNDAVQAFDVRFPATELQKVVAQLKSSYGTPVTEANEVINRKGGEKREVYKVLWQRGKDRALLVSIRERSRVTLNVARGNFEEEIYRVK